MLLLLHPHNAVGSTRDEFVWEKEPVCLAAGSTSPDAPAQHFLYTTNSTSAKIHTNTTTTKAMCAPAASRPERTTKMPSTRPTEPMVRCRMNQQRRLRRPGLSDGSSGLGTCGRRTAFSGWMRAMTSIMRPPKVWGTVKWAPSTIMTATITPTTVAQQAEMSNILWRTNQKALGPVVGATLRNRMGIMTPNGARMVHAIAMMVP